MQQTVQQVKLLADVNYETVTAKGPWVSYGEKPCDTQIIGADSIVLCVVQFEEFNLALAAPHPPIADRELQKKKASAVVAPVGCCPAQSRISVPFGWVIGR